MENPSSSVGNRWLLLPASVLQRPDLSSGCKLLFGTLCQLARANGHCWPSHQYLADALGMSRRTVQNHLQALFRAKLVEIRPGRAGAVLRYYPLQEASTDFAGGQAEPPSVSAASKPVRGCAKRAQGCERIAHNKSINNINTNPPYPPRRESRGSASRFTPEAGEEDFTHLWAAWPVHQGEKEARRVFLRLHRTNALPEVDALIRTVATFREQDSRWIRGKVKLLSHWLRGHCWNDAPYVEPRFPAGSGTFSPTLPSPLPAIQPGGNQRGQQVKQPCARPEQPSPLPEPDALNKLLALWPERPEDGMEPMIRGAWRYTLSARRLSGTRVVEAAKCYLAGVNKPLRLEQWLRQECARVGSSTA